MSEHQHHRPLDEKHSMREASKVLELTRAYTLNDTYRNYHKELSPEAAAGLPYVPVHEWGVDLTEEESEAQAEHLRAIDLEKAIGRVGIDISSPVGRLFGVENVREMMRCFPAITFEGLKQITLQGRSDEDISALELVTGARMAGFHDHDLPENNAQIVIFTDDLDEALMSLPGMDMENYARIMVAQRLIHELGHALHHTLPVSLLDAWDRAAVGEDVEVSDYVENAAKHNQPTLKLEDFAETAKLFILRPDDLKQAAPARYDAMSSIFSQTKR